MCHSRNNEQSDTSAYKDLYATLTSIYCVSSSDYYFVEITFFPWILYWELFLSLRPVIWHMVLCESIGERFWGMIWGQVKIETALMLLQFKFYLEGETALAPFYDSTLQAESPCKHLGSVLRIHIDRVFWCQHIALLRPDFGKFRPLFGIS